MGLFLIFSNIYWQYINSFTSSYIHFLETVTRKWTTLFAPKIFKLYQKRKTLCEKCPNTELLVRIFLHSDWIWRDTPYLSVFSLNKGKYGPEKSLYMGTFHAVKPILRVTCCRWSWIFFKKTFSRSSHPKEFCKTISLKYLPKLTGDYLHKSIFKKYIRWQCLETLFQKRLVHRCFPVHFLKFFRTGCLWFR